MLQGHTPSGRSRGGSFLLLAASGGLRSPLACGHITQCRPPCPRGLLSPRLCPNFSFLIGTQRDRSGPPHPGWPHGHLIPSAKTPFQNKASFTGPQWTLILYRHCSTPQCPQTWSLLDPQEECRGGPLPSGLVVWSLWVGRPPKLWGHCWLVPPEVRQHSSPTIPTEGGKTQEGGRVEGEAREGASHGPEGTCWSSGAAVGWPRRKKPQLETWGPRKALRS